MKPPFSNLRDLLSKATPGNWSIGNGRESTEDSIYSDNKNWICNAGIPYNPDANFIAESHNQLPRVLAALDLAMGALEFYASAPANPKLIDIAPKFRGVAQEALETLKGE